MTEVGKMTQHEHELVLTEIFERLKDVIAISGLHISKKELEMINGETSIELSWGIHLVGNDIRQILSRIRRNQQ